MREISDAGGAHSGAPRSHADLVALKRGRSADRALVVHGGLVDHARTAATFAVCRDEVEGDVYCTTREIRPHATMWPTVHHTLDILKT